tara:strand:+ start:1211 stop:1486 length:276 start_codon:yes stop_codon:yes gene_type:complete
MQSYLSGRGGEHPGDGKSKEGFRSYLDATPSSGQNEIPTALPPEDPVDLQSEVIYEKEGCPKVEVSSIDGKPVSINIHLPDGRLLKLDCEY